jgi:hypothetical protein
MKYLGDVIKKICDEENSLLPAEEYKKRGLDRRDCSNRACNRQETMLYFIRWSVVRHLPTRSKVKSHKRTCRNKVVHLSTKSHLQARFFVLEDTLKNLWIGVTITVVYTVSCIVMTAVYNG